MSFSKKEDIFYCLLIINSIEVHHKIILRSFHLVLKNYISLCIKNNIQENKK